MMRAGLAALALFVLCAPRAAAELPPIPTEVWDIKEADTKGSGALIVERTMRFDAAFIEHSFLIRVLSEQGKQAVEFSKFPASAKIEGRTVTREGQESPFKASSDFQTKALVKTGEGSLDQKAFVPPGLTSDCVVQIRWTETSYFGSLGSGWDYKVQDRIFQLGTSLPTRRMVLEVNASVGWAYDLQTGPRGAEVINGKASRTAIFRDLPAYEWVPYSEESAKDNPKFVLYQQPRFLMEAAGKGEEAYWSKVANNWWRPFYEGKYQFGKTWGDFENEMRKNLPVSKQEAALELHKRLLARIKDVAARLPEEVAAQPTKDAKKEIDPRDFAAALKSGETTGNGFMLLYYFLLGQASIQAKPVLLVDRRVRKFRYKQCNLAQFENTYFLIEEEGRPPLFIDPGRRLSDPEIIHTKYQGEWALVLVPGQAWTYKQVQIPIQDGSHNTSLTEIHIDVSEEKDQIHLSSTFTGGRAWSERSKWWSLMPEERNRGLKDALAKLDPALQVERASVGGIAQQPFEWSADAVRERDVSRRLEVSPFPMSEPPLYLPKDLPALRKEPIVLWQIGSDEVRTVIKVPTGYRFAGAPDFSQSNAFGDVTWTAAAVAGKTPVEVIVTYKVRTKALVSAPSLYPRFKEFLAWVGESFNRTIILNRVAP